MAFTSSRLKQLRLGVSLAVVAGGHGLYIGMEIARAQDIGKISRIRLRGHDLNRL